ncbi:MAG: VOC family protein [Chloroflexi bacterium]|nr:VOC family protein [Chloroflexota bacterium]
MSLHRLTSVTIGVPNVDETALYYCEFGLNQSGDDCFQTRDGGEQLKLVHADRRRLVELRIGGDDPDDLERIASQLRRIDVDVRCTPATLQARDPGTDVEVVVELAPRISERVTSETPYNGPGRDVRLNVRAPLFERGPVRPSRLGHAVMGCTDLTASRKFFYEGIGFKVSDEVRGLGVFLRCSTDHHNLLLQSAPLNFLHHTSWQVDDVDEIGRGATCMLEGHPERHVWGFGRHHIGSNFFWYLCDPAGNFTEYYSDMDCIVDDQLWKPGTFEAVPSSLYGWGPPPPASFFLPEDVAAQMVGAHRAG